MARLEWTSEFETGNSRVDEQHKKFIVLSNTLKESVENGTDKEIVRAAFNALLGYTNKHFKDEEDFWAGVDTEMMEEHQREHRILVNELEELWHQSRFNSDLGERLRDWVETRLLTHFLKSDVDMLWEKPEADPGDGP